MTGVAARVSSVAAPPPHKALVAVVDANAEHRRQVSSALSSYYQVVDFAQLDPAMEILSRAPPCVILVDELCRTGGGGDSLPLVRRHLPGVPVIRTASHVPVRTAAAGADAFLEKPYRRSSLIRTISSLVNKAVEAQWEALAPQYRQSLQKTMEGYNVIADRLDKGEPLDYSEVSGACSSLVDVVGKHDFKVILDSVKGHDNYSYVHSLRVATLLTLFGHAIGLKGDDMTLLASGGLVHDIGKMKIPHAVLNKPGRLDDGELAVMRRHVPVGAEYLRHCGTFPKGVVTIAEQHHEKLDGSGYPNGLKGAQLNELARMSSIADIFSALTDRRVYKEPMAPEDALALMSDGMARDIDMTLLGMFKQMLLDAVSPASA